jgi:hypothetical protein
MNVRQTVSAGKLRVAARVERVRLNRTLSAAIQDDPDIGAYSGLTRYSLALAKLNLAQQSKPAVNLVLPSLSAGGLFAGVRTAVEVGIEVSRSLNRKLRVLAFSGPHSRADRAAIRRLMCDEFKLDVDDWELVPAVTIPTASFHQADVWIATYWTTAHALDVRARLGLLDPSRVIYLIQDYEPSFLPASTDAFIAGSTYKAGFVPLVNSSPLASALMRNANVKVDKSQVFAPQLDLARLQQVNIGRKSVSSAPEVLFYGRPSKPRNMFQLGVSALRRVVQSGDASNWTFSSVGEMHGSVSLGRGVTLRPLGGLTWPGYFERIARSQIMLSLQASPHPSHPPLDMVASGGRAVTNEVDDTRRDLHPNLAVADADPDALALKLAAQMRHVEAGGQTFDFDSTFVSKLGVPMADAAAAAAALVRGE